jgi:phosphoribosylanthranilate isomerase
VFYNTRMLCGVKICGVTSVTDAVVAAELGASAIGLNFYTKSPRCIDEATALEIINALPKNVVPYMLAVDESWHETLARVKRLRFTSWIQVHRTRHMACPDPNQCWMPAFPIKDQLSLESIDELLNRCREERRWAPTAVLVDAHVAGSFGGTGQTAPWDLVVGWRQSCSVNVILAGGLTPDNVALAIRTVRPYMVDVASGVESSPGKKDADKMRRFIDAARSA